MAEWRGGGGSPRKGAGLPASKPHPLLARLLHSNVPLQHATNDLPKAALEDTQLDGNTVSYME